MRHRTRGRRRFVGLPVLCASALVMAVGVSPAWANVTAVTGSTYGYRAYNISLFGGSQSDTGPTPSATLASNASNSPQSGSATSGLVAYGPAVLFTSDGISVDSTGTTGAGGYVFTEASVDNINKSTTQPSLTGSEILTADNIYSECLATSATPSGSTSISGGSLQTDSGLDLNGDGDYTDAGEHAPVSVTLPSSPTANTTYYGHIHLSSTATDNWKLVFNEQSTVSGTLTVNAVHEYFGVTSSGNDPNSVLHGDLVIGRAVCGLTF